MNYQEKLENFLAACEVVKNNADKKMKLFRIQMKMDKIIEKCNCSVPCANCACCADDVYEEEDIEQDDENSFDEEEDTFEEEEEELVSAGEIREI